MKEMQTIRLLMKALLNRDLDDVVFIGNEKGERLENVKLIIRKKSMFEKVKK